MGCKRLRIDSVDFGQRNDFGLFVKAMAIGLELAADGFIGRARVASSGIDEMEQDAAAFDMAQESVAEPVSLMRPFDQAGNIGKDEFAAIAIGNAKLRVDSAEGLGGDFWLCRADGGEKG